MTFVLGRCLGCEEQGPHVGAAPEVAVTPVQPASQPLSRGQMILPRHSFERPTHDVSLDHSGRRIRSVLDLLRTEYVSQRAFLAVLGRFLLPVPVDHRRIDRADATRRRSHDVGGILCTQGAPDPPLDRSRFTSPTIPLTTK